MAGPFSELLYNMTMAGAQPNDIPLPILFRVLNWFALERWIYLWPFWVMTLKKSRDRNLEIARTS